MFSSLRACLVGALLVVAGAAASAAAQTPTVGVFINDDASYPGYTLFGPFNSTKVFLISNDGLLVHEWETGYEPKHMGYLLPNGNLLRAAEITVGLGGLIQQHDWDGNLVWEYYVDEANWIQHHDIEPMPNGNVLIIAYETKTAAESIAAGRDPLGVVDEMIPEVIVEIEPTFPSGGNVVWEWHAWDHMIQDFDPTKDNWGVVGDHPELIDINFGQPPTPDHPDIHHANGIAYNAELDQIALSVRQFSEFWVIDHGTTTAEAATHTGGTYGKGGDVLYRWGNPASYDAGTDDDRTLWFQHDIQWIAPGLPGAGNMLMYNNGINRPAGNYSTIEEIVTPVDESGFYSLTPGEAYGPAAPVWNYQAPVSTDFYSPFVSGAQRQPNGNTVICEGIPGHFFEVTASKDVVWSYVNPVYLNGIAAQGDPVPSSNNVFKIRRYGADYPAFVGRDLTPGNPIELFSPPIPPASGSLTAERLTPSGDQIGVAWDAVSCASFDFHLLYGDLAAVSTQDLLGAECNMGMSGAHVWNDPPAGSLYFLVVGTEHTGIYESTWGANSSGDPRNGYTASFQCGTTTKVVSSTCP